MILSALIQRGLVRGDRLVRLVVEVPDVPGVLGALCRRLGELDANIVDLHHQRAFAGASVRAAEVELVLQMHGEAQTQAVLEALRTDGYEARRA